ncbi:MAG: YihY/virulence factor BrkB family protein [Bacteroidetes bacterium]|nr:YihY/virulence factor BrkB family protein [Bacteroidota bacterium]
MKTFTAFINWLKKLVLPGFDGLPLYEVTSFFYRGLWQGSISTRASALSFSFFLALFPAIIFFFTLIPYIPIDGFQDALLSMLKNILPKDTYQSTLSTMEDIIKRQHGGLLSIGFIAALFFSTSGISGIMSAFNESIHVAETRSYIKQRIVAVFMVLILSVLIIIAIALIIAGTDTLDYFYRKGYLQENLTYYTLLFGNWIVVIALFFLIISFLYFLAPAKHLRFRFISAGSTLATILFVISTLGFNFYISNFSQYNKLYGSIGALIIILMWIYINAIVILIGFELNASIRNAKKRKA